MAKIEYVKCRHCGKKIDKSTAYSITKGQYYCCEEHYLSTLEKKKNKGNHSYKSAKGTDRRNYTDYLLNLYIQEGFSKSFPNWQIIMSQTNNILKNNPQWTYESIKYILWYEKEILDIRLITKEGNWSPLSLVEFYGAEAERYYNQCVDIDNAIDSFDFNNESKTIRKSNINIASKKYKEININEL